MMIDDDDDDDNDRNVLFQVKAIHNDTLTDNTKQSVIIMYMSAISIEQKLSCMLSMYNKLA